MARLLIAFMLTAAVATAAENPETLTERSQARARLVLDAAVDAIGGAEALQAVDTMRLQLEGETWPRLQMPTPAPPFEAGSFRETLTFDLRNNRVVSEQIASGGGFNGHNTIVLKPGEGTNYDHRAHTATPIPAAQTQQQQFVQYHRRLPNLLLRQALDRVVSLRYLGEEQFDGRKHDVITFAMPDAQQIALYVDARTGLVSKYELLFVDPLTGDDAAEIMFGDYTTSGKLKVPQTWTWRVAGDIQARYKIKAEFNPALSDKTFEVAEDGFTRVAANPANPEAGVEKLADGVYVIQNVAGPNQNTLAVEFADHVFAVEAPGTSAGADNVIKRIKETIPGKPIRYVGVTHHHGDHIGGLRSFIAEGATVVTTANNRGVVERMANAPQKDRLFRNPRKTEFALLENGRRVFTDGKRTIELIDIGPNPHAREMVIAYLPKERVVFQGDLFFVPNNERRSGRRSRPRSASRGS
jgi:glyoxylase-like metal-dependent hydrolase (beta-lactamase superfamily II)